MSGPWAEDELIKDSILSLVGNTPLLEIRNIGGLSGGVEIYAKAEWFNPGGSIKDRPVLRMIAEAIKSGQLTREKTILDSTSGNAGIAYAMVGAVLGYKVELVMPENASQERKKLMRAYGAEIIFTRAVDGYDAAIEEAHRRYKTHPNRYFMPDQYENPFNPQAHYDTTGEEILKQTGGRVTHFVGGVGTGGTIMGVGQRLKEYNEKIKIYAVEPEEFPGIEGLKPMGQEYIVPEIYDESLVDGTIPVTSDEAKAMCERLARDEGLFVGHSSGAYLKGGLELAKEIDEGVIVTVFSDGGSRYLSTPLWERG